MKAANVLKHVAIVIIGVFIIICIPFLCVGGLQKVNSGDADVVSSASIVLDAPSGNYVVLINKDVHNDKENFDKWVTFFSTGESSIIFEDITCSVSKDDAGAIEMAKSFQSKLPENQMKIYEEDTTLLMSRADEGKFDIIIMSKELEEAYHSETGYENEVEHIDVKEVAE